MTAPGRERHASELERENQRLREELEAVWEELERSREENERLRKELQEALQANQRSAAPYSRGQRVAHPKRPGRKPKQGVFRFRAAPEATEVVEAVAPSACPSCGGPLVQEGVEYASRADLPARPQPEITLYRVPVCRCKACGRRVRGRARGLAKDQYGATAHRVGAGVMAAAHHLHYGLGVPMRKVPAVLGELTGVNLTQGALTQDALRRAEREVGAAYDRLRKQVRQAPVVYTDDTGWRLGGQPAYLMVFDTDRVTVYQIRRQHRNEEVRELVPSDYRGVLVADRGKSYDARELAEVAQQKCVPHLVRNIRAVVEAKRGRARCFGLRLQELLQQALQLRKKRRRLKAKLYRRRVQRLEKHLTYHLRDRFLPDPDNQRLLDGIGAQHDRGNVLRFLYHPAVEPTNNRSERQLRPGVIARKVSHCSKNERGAEAHAAFVSVIQTAVKNRSRSATESLRILFSRPEPKGASP